MEQARIMFELDSSRSVVRTAEVIGHRRGLYTVRWNDGATEELRPGRRDDHVLVVVVRDGLQHRKLVDLDRAREVFESEPVEAFFWALREADEPQLGRELVNRVGQVFGPEEVSRAWKRSRAAFERDPRVRVLGGKPARYTIVTARRELAGGPEPLTDSEQDELVVDEGQAQNASTANATTDGRRVTAASDYALEAPVDTRESLDASATSASPSKEEVATTLRQLVKDPAAPVAPGLDHHLRRDRALSGVYGALRGDLTKEAIARLITAPLAAGVRLAELPDAVLVAAAKSDPALIPALVSIPRPTATTDSPAALEALDAPVVGALLDRAAHELRSANRGAKGRLGPLTSALRSLVTRLSNTRHATLGQVLHAISAVDRSSAPQELAEELVDALARAALRTSPGGWARISEGARSTLALWANRCAFRPDGPRTSLLTAVYRIDPGVLAEDRWWTGAGYDGLAAAADGAFIRVLEDQAVSDGVVAPTVRRALDEAGTRRRLMTVLSSPPALARHLSGSEVRAAVLRLAADDPLLRDWIHAIADTHGRDAVEAELTREASAHDGTRQELARARDELRHLEDALHRVEGQLEQAAASTSGLRESQARQAKIDAVRSLAELATYVEGALERQPPERITARVASIAARNGLVRLGEPGSAVPYDPAQHDLVGAPCEPGSTVLVRRVGYTWTEDDVVLVQALVEQVA